MNVIVKNTSPKIINIGKAALLPDETLPVSQDVANVPAIKAMVERGQLSIEEDKEATATAEESERIAKEEAEQRVGEGDVAKTGESGEKPGESSEEKKPLSRMNKAELLAECKRFGIEVKPDDTNPDLVEKIKAVTAE